MPATDFTYNDKAQLAQAIGLVYPDNPKQVSKASLVLSYLLDKGMRDIESKLKENTSISFYIDDFSKEVYLTYYRESANVYVNSKQVDPETNTPLYSLGTEMDAKLGVIEYKVRKELLALMKENPTKIDELEQGYDARDERSPFGWVRQIKTGYFNVLLGGKNRNNQKPNRLLDRTGIAVSRVNATPAERGGDRISRGN